MITSTDRWWKAKQNVHEALVGDVKVLKSKLQHRSDKNLESLRLYSNQYVQSLDGDAYDQVSPYDPDRLVINVIQTVINAMTAKISTNRPRAMPITEGGNWSIQQQAKQLGKFIDGHFHGSQVYAMTRRVFRDACIFGTGALKVSPDYRDPKNPKIKVERRIIEDYLVDPIDGKYGKPRMLHEAINMSREVAIATWPKHKSRLLAATQWLSDTASDVYSDPVTIVEGWHLPSSPTAGDGRRVVACDAGTLDDDAWEIERFPVGFFRWLTPTLGFYGESLTSQLVGIQVEMNKILLKVQQHMHLASSFVMAERGSKIVKEHLTNTPWTLLEYTGQAPVFATVAAISPEYFMQLDRLYAKAFEIAGITQLFATGLKPAGLDSGVAQREYKDTESERFMDVSQAWEDFHVVDVAERMIDTAKEISESDSGDISVLAMSERGQELERIEWADVDLERDKYVLQVHPTSYLPRLPAFRFQAVKDILEIAPEMQPYAMRLLDYPDLKAAVNRITAPVDYLEQVTDRMLYGKADDMEDLYESPDSFTDVRAALEIARGKLLRAKIDGAPEERRDLVMRYMTECERLAAQAEEAAMQQQMAMQAAMQPPTQPPMPESPQAGAGPEMLPPEMLPGMATGEPVQ